MSQKDACSAHGLPTSSDNVLSNIGGHEEALNDTLTGTGAVLVSILVMQMHHWKPGSSLTLAHTSTACMTRRTFGQLLLQP